MKQFGNAAVIGAQPRRQHGARTDVKRFLWHLMQMVLAMEVGMMLFHVLEGMVVTPLGFGAALQSGTTLNGIGMAAFMTAAMVAWMLVRGHGWRHGAEMAGAMLVPIAVVTVLCLLGIDVYLPWLRQSSDPAMYLGMLAAMLYRREHYLGRHHARA